MSAGDLGAAWLAAREAPLEVVVVGLGFMARGFLGAAAATEGLAVPALVSRRPDAAREELATLGHPARVLGLEEALAAFPEAVVLELTGDIPYGVEVAEACFAARRPLLTMNAELQATCGHRLAELAAAAGVPFSEGYGDQPANLARLVRRARHLGFRVRAAGNMKRYLRTGATRAEMRPWAEKQGMSLGLTVASTDGTKQALELSLVANAFGFGVAPGGLRGPEVEAVAEIPGALAEALPGEGAVVDFARGLSLPPGVFVVAEHRDPGQASYLEYLRLGTGNRVLLYEPFHLCHLELVESLVALAGFGQASLVSRPAPSTRVVARAKRDLGEGEALAGIGGDEVFGTVESLPGAAEALPIGLAAGARVRAAVPAGAVLRVQDVEVPRHAASRLLGFA